MRVKGMLEVESSSKISKEVKRKFQGKLRDNFR